MDIPTIAPPVPSQSPWINVDLLIHALPPPSLVAAEVNEGHAYSLSAEVYNFGSVLYECMTGVVLLAQEPQVLPRSPGTEALRRSAERRGGGFPDELWCLQAACWARDPRKRPSFAALLDRLTALQLALAL